MGAERDARRKARILGLLMRHRILERSNGAAGPVLLTAKGAKFPFDESAVRALRAEGLVTACDGGTGIRITAAGATWLARHVAGGSGNEERADIVSAPAPDDPAQMVVVNRSESPLARLARPAGSDAPWLDGSEYEAGERLRTDFEIGALRQRVTSSWDLAHLAGAGGGRAGDSLTLGEQAMDARRRLARALAAVGPEYAGVLVDVCCFLKGLEQVETERRWPRRSAKLLLKAGLSALDRHYYPAIATGRPGRIRQWGAPGFRPEFLA